MIERMFRLDGKVAVVTGASSGIGLHVAGVFARAGAAVVLAARRMDRIDAAVGDLVAAGLTATGVYLDVTDASSVKAAFDAVETKWGRPANLLFNNSGAIYLKRFLDQDEAEVCRIIDTNLKGAFRVAQTAAARMSAAGGGVIINVASTAGLRAGGLLSSYAASKAALIHLTKVMALELAPKDIRVNALCPGNIETDMHQTFSDGGLDDAVLKRIPQRRFGRPDDLDGAALLLASEAGRYMTGATLVVDGGQTLSWM